MWIKICLFEENQNIVIWQKFNSHYLFWWSCILKFFGHYELGSSCNCFIKNDNSKTMSLKMLQNQLPVHLILILVRNETFCTPPPLSWRLLNTQLLVNYKLNSWMPSTISGVNTIWMFPISCYILGLKIPMLEVVTLLILFQDGMALNTQCFQYALLEFTSTGKSTSHSSLQFIIS